MDFSDWLPTFVELAGGAVPQGLDGISFAARLRGGDASRRRWAYAYHTGMSCVRTQRWKLYDDDRLFDMGARRSEAAPVPRSTASSQSMRARSGLEQALRSLGGAD